jgi:hypothetical protein
MSPVRSIGIFLAAESPGRGSGSPHNCRPLGLTIQRPADPRLGTKNYETRDFVRACPRIMSGSSLFCPLSSLRSPKKGLTLIGAFAGSGAVIECHVGDGCRIPTLSLNE